MTISTTTHEAADDQGDLLEGLQTEFEGEELLGENAPSVFSHNGIFTCTNNETGKHRTFQIKTVRKKKGDDEAPKSDRNAKFRRDMDGKRIAYLLTGPSNTSDYTGFAFINEDSVHVWHSKRGHNEGGKYNRTDWERYGLLLQDPEKYIRKGYTIKFAVTCRRCNRTLTTPESIASGIGPICAGIKEAL